MNQFQLDLFAHVAASYAEAPDGALDNGTLYSKVADRAGIDLAAIDACVPIGAAGSLRSPAKRKIRWYQQTLKQLGVIERVEGARGIWRLTESAGKELHKTVDGVKLVAFSTDLGVAIWGRCQNVFGNISEPIALCVTSPPYPLRQARAYGNPDESHYVNFICSALEPIVGNLVPGGSIVLNISNDIFESKSPARSLYVERLILALHDRLGLALMDRMPYGVIQHELGHHVDVTHSTQFRAYRGDFSINLRKETGEQPISGYCPDDGEWFAELFRVFVTNPDLLRIIRPATYERLCSRFVPVVAGSWQAVLAQAPERTKTACAKKVSEAMRIVNRQQPVGALI